jgi:hypothetical protein
MPSNKSMKNPCHTDETETVLVCQVHKGGGRWRNTSWNGHFAA